MESIPFTEEDLILNKRRKLSVDQQQRIKNKAIFEALIYGLVFVALFIAFPFIFPELLDHFFIAGIAVFIAFTIWIIVIFHRINNHKAIKAVEGAPEYKIAYGGEHSNIPNYIVKVGSLTFNVEEAVFDAFAGQEVRVYYFQIPKKIVLSAEIL